MPINKRIINVQPPSPFTDSIEGEGVLQVPKQLIEEHDRLVQHNLEHPEAKVYSLQDLKEWQKQQTPLYKFLNTQVKVPVTTGTASALSTTGKDIPTVDSTVGKELGYVTSLVTTPMLSGEFAAGVIPGLVKIAGGTAGATGASYLLGKEGDKADERLGTNYLFGPLGRVAGGFLGYGAGSRAAYNSSLPRLALAAQKHNWSNNLFGDQAIYDSVTDPKILSKLWRANQKQKNNLLSIENIPTIEGRSQNLISGPKEPLLLDWNQNAYYRNWLKYINRWLNKKNKYAKQYSHSIGEVDFTNPVKVDLELSKNPEQAKAAVRKIIEDYNTFKGAAPDYREMNLPKEQVESIDAQLKSLGLDPLSHLDRLRFAVEYPHERSKVNIGTNNWINGDILQWHSHRQYPFQSEITIKREVPLGEDLYEWPLLAEWNEKFSPDLRSRAIHGKPLYKIVNERLAQNRDAISDAQFEIGEALRLTPDKFAELQSAQKIIIPRAVKNTSIRKDAEPVIYLPRYDQQFIDDWLKQTNAKLERLKMMPINQPHTVEDYVFTSALLAEINKRKINELFKRGVWGDMTKSARSQLGRFRQAFFDSNSLRRQYARNAIKIKQDILNEDSNVTTGYPGLDAPTYDTGMWKLPNRFSIVDYKSQNDNHLPSEITIPTDYRIPTESGTNIPTMIEPSLPMVMPGLQLNSTMFNSPLQKRLDKSGFIKRNVLDNYIKNLSKTDKEILTDVLKNYFDKQDKINYQQLRYAIQQIIPANKRTSTGSFGDYGLNYLGMPGVRNWNTPPEYVPMRHTSLLINPIGGNPKHFSESPIGHYRMFTDKENPNVFYVTENQSDYFEQLGKALAKQKEEDDWRSHYWVNPFTEIGQNKQWYKINRSDRDAISKEALRLEPYWKERQLQEAMLEALNDYKATLFRYPTRETAAKIEGYPEVPIESPQWRTEAIEYLKYTNPEFRKLWDAGQKLEKMVEKDIEQYNFIFDRINEMIEELKNSGTKLYMSDGHINYNRILQQYMSFPRYAKSLGWGEPRIVTDKYGSWYEVDVPQDYNMQERRAYQLGGKINNMPYANLK